MTIQEKEKELIHQRELEQAAKRLADDRHRETLKVGFCPSLSSCLAFSLDMSLDVLFVDCPLVYVWVALA